MYRMEIMIKSYIKTACRNIKKHKLFFLINISGLSIGLICCTLMLILIMDTLSFDRFHEKSGNLYRILADVQYEDWPVRVTNTPLLLGQAIKEEIPGVADITRILHAGRSVIKCRDKVNSEDGVAYAEPSLFNMFTFPFVYGDPEQALSDPSSIIIDEEIAEKYFGGRNPVGETLNFNNRLDLTVRGVIKRLPENSSIQFRILLPIENITAENSQAEWDTGDYETYVLLRDKISAYSIDNLLQGIVKKHTDKPVVYSLQPVTDIKLYGIDGNGDLSMIFVFSFISFIVLFIGCVNFMNMSTASAGSRALEIGLRKVIGAGRKDIIKQCLGESVTMAAAALFIALPVICLILPHFNELSGRQIPFNLITGLKFFAGSVVTAIITGIIAGSYPAFFLASFEPVKVMKGMLKSGKKGLKLRQIMVVIQFTFSLIFIISMMLVNRQFSYLKDIEPGYNKENLIFFPMNGDIAGNFDSFKNKILQNPDILNVSFATGFPNGPMHGFSGKKIEWEGKKHNINMCGYYVDQDFLKTFKIKVVQGRDFSGSYTKNKAKFIMNEAAVKATGIDSPVGKRFTVNGKTGTIKAVIKDFHYTYTDRKIEPFILSMRAPKNNDYMFIKLKSGYSDLPGVLSHIENSWTGYAPGYPFEYEFLDERINRTVAGAENILSFINLIPFFSIFISCLGLSALASYLTIQRKKEIAVRKVLGASAAGIAAILSKEFVRWVFVSILIAWPVTWLIMNSLLNNFANRISIGWSAFVISGLSVLLLALITVCYQVINAASANPAYSLKHD